MLNSTKRLEFEENSPVSVRSPRIAPRSPQHFDIGPEFEDSEIVTPLYTCGDNQVINPNLTARIDRGIHSINGQWTGYRRNFFSICSAFSFPGTETKLIAKNRFYIKRQKQQKVKLDSFCIRLRSKCVGQEGFQDFVQAGPRRLDPKQKPRIITVLPGCIPSHARSRQIYNFQSAKNSTEKVVEFLQDVDSWKVPGCSSILDTYPEQKALIVANYDRLVFPPLATGQRSSSAARFHKVVVELLGKCQDGSLVVLRRINTTNIQIRLQSPSQYMDSLADGLPMMQTKCSRNEFKRMKLGKGKHNVLGALTIAENTSGQCSTNKNCLEILELTKMKWGSSPFLSADVHHPNGSVDAKYKLDYKDTLEQSFLFSADNIELKGLHARFESQETDIFKIIDDTSDWHGKVPRSLQHESLSCIISLEQERSLLEYIKTEQEQLLFDCIDFQLEQETVGLCDFKQESLFYDLVIQQNDNIVSRGDK